MRRNKQKIKTRKERIKGRNRENEERGNLKHES